MVTDQRRFEMLGIRGVRKYYPYLLVLWDRLLIIPTEAGHQRHTGGLLAQIGTVDGGNEETGIYKTHAGVVSGCGTGYRGIRR